MFEQLFFSKLTRGILVEGTTHVDPCFHRSCSLPRVLQR
jgi:hypothetical protein